MAVITTRSPQFNAIMNYRKTAQQIADATKGWATKQAASPVARRLQDVLLDGAWQGQRCFLIGGGPSLKGFDFERLRGERVIVINKAFLDVPFADIVFAMDRPLIDLITSGKLGEDYRRAFEDFGGVKLWLDLSGYQYPPGVYSLPAAGDIGWTRSLAHGLFHGQNSGYGAINLALVLGADPIYLLGYDCALGPGGEKHYHNGYPSGMNPDAMNIFRHAFESGAAVLPPGAPKIINLNPNSALRCFAFVDVDQVIPVPQRKPGSITAITPTGDRPLAFALCQQWMRAQTRRPDQWIVIDDGREPLTPTPDMQYIRRAPQADDPPHTLAVNLKAALPLIRGDKVLVFEDDEYYAPRYIEEMARRLEAHEVVGICRSKYYHLPTGGFRQIGNTGHASLAQTAFRASFLPTFAQCVENGMATNWVDQQIWKLIADSRGGINAELFVDDDPLYVGIKGLPGRPGIGQGHKTQMYQDRDNADRAMLRKWIPADFAVYMDILGDLT